MEQVLFRDLGKMDYGPAWDYQESLLQENVRAKTEWRQQRDSGIGLEVGASARMQETGSVRSVPTAEGPSTRHHLLFVEHPPVYTLGKSGHMENVLIDAKGMVEKGVQFFRTNRGGDITFHGEGQIVGYPVLDLERFYTDIGKYLRNLEEVIIRVLAAYGIEGLRSPGETGVWIEPGVKGRERKICAIGVRCSRWVTMHGFAFNVNTDLGYFSDIIPCGIQDKEVTSLQKELGYALPMEEVKERVMRAFEDVFDVELRMEDGEL